MAQEHVAEQAETRIGSNDIIECVDVNKWYGEFHVLKDIDLTVKEREVVVVIGPSGSGKSTLIRCMNRLEEHQEGQIIIDGIELSNDVSNISAIRREIGMVFQQFNLFPHLTVLPKCYACSTLCTSSRASRCRKSRP